MTEEPWPHRPPPDRHAADHAEWPGPTTLIDVVLLRRKLTAAVADGLAPACTDDDDIARLLLAFGELTTNVVRHGRPPSQVVVSVTGHGWLIEVSDAAPDRPPTPPVGRDPGQGGLGLLMVSRLCAGYGWLSEGETKRVWAHVICTAAGATDGVAGRLRDTVAELTTVLSHPPEVRIAGPVEGLREDLVTDLFAVLHEALVNVDRHAEAGRVEVDIAVASGTVTLQVVDDGRGIGSARWDGGLGDLRRRALWHGGTLSVGSAEESGTRLVWQVPESRRPILD